MSRRRKLIAAWAPLLLLSLACGASGSVDSRQLPGCWEANPSLRECFHADGSYEIIRGGTPTSGTWTMQGDRTVTITTNGEARNWEIARLTESELQFGLVTYQRVEEQGSAPGGLGGGYRNARWGMNVDQVVAALGGTVERRTDTFLMLNASDSSEIKCWFDDAGLNRVEYHPAASTIRDAAGVTALLRILERRHGAGQSVPNQVDATLGIPLQVRRWNDGETQITFRMWDPNASDRLGADALAGTVSVIYESLDANRRAAAAQQQENERVVREREEALEGNL